METVSNYPIFAKINFIPN